MTPETAMVWLELVMAIEFFILVLIIGYHQFLYPSPEVIYYMQNCNNLTLYPQGCQVLS